MAPRPRGTWNTKGMWAAGGLAAVVVLLTGYAMFSGDDDGGAGTAGKGPGPSASSSASASPTYAAPEDWTEPERWAALPRGKRTDDNGNAVGFPHTTEGAVSMLAASGTTVVEGGRTTVEEQLGVYESYVISSEKSSKAAEQIELNAIQTDKKFHRQMGLAPGSDLPTGAYVRSHTVAFKVIEESPDEVSVWLLSRVTTKAGETSKEKASYARSLLGAQWEDGDWKLSYAATKRAFQANKSKPKPAMAAPGDAAFNDAGWTALREAS